MKSLSLILALAAERAAAHAIFQDLWVNSVDMGSQCARLPMSNTPVTNVGGASIRCNVGGTTPAKAICPAKQGDVITVEMHQQPGDRSCSNEAIGGSHYGPVMVYLSKVQNAATADGSSDWFKVYQNSWTSKGGVGDADDWGVKDMNKCCGRVDVPIPDSLPDGDYLLRAEVIALHAQPAQLYMTCYQIKLEGGASPSASLPAGVKFPGAYKASDPGIAANIHAKLSQYIAPGPAVIEGGTEVTAGSGCTGKCETGCKAGAQPMTTLDAAPAAATGAPGGGLSGAACQVAQWQQCGGTGYTGCTTCASGLTCSNNNPYYRQCT